VPVALTRTVGLIPQFPQCKMTSQEVFKSIPPLLPEWHVNLSMAVLSPTFNIQHPVNELYTCVTVVQLFSYLCHARDMTKLYTWIERHCENDVLPKEHDILPTARNGT